MNRKPLAAMALAASLAVAPCAAPAQLVHGNPGQAENNAPDSRNYRVADERTNHPRRNPRKRVCRFYRDAAGHRHRHCTWR